MTIPEIDRAEFRFKYAQTRCTLCARAAISFSVKVSVRLTCLEVFTFISDKCKVISILFPPVNPLTIHQPIHKANPQHLIPSSSLFHLLNIIKPP